MKTTLSTVFLLAVAAYANAQHEAAYFSHKGKAFDVDGFDANSYSYTGFNKYGKDKYGRSYTEAGSGNGAEVDAGGRKMPPKPPVTTSTDADPTESGDWENYWPSFKEGGGGRISKNGITRNKHGDIVDKAWYHLSNRPAPTVTETQTQFEFTEVYITSSVAPTEDFWCDGGWIQITKEGDLMDDDWAVAYITGYLQLIGANVDDVDTYDWCVNTNNHNNTGACAYQQAASHNPTDVAAAFAAATDDHTSQIILFVCDLPCLDSICQATQENYAKLTPLRLKEITFTKTSGSARNISTPCVDGEGIYAPGNGAGGKTYNFCPQGQSCSANNGTNPGDPDCVCQSCPDLAACLAPSCPVMQTAVPPATDPVWELTPTCSPVNGVPACELGNYQGMNGLCTKCAAVDNCLQTQCTSADNAMCYGPCEGTYLNTAAPGGAGMCICTKDPKETACDVQCPDPSNCAQVNIESKIGTQLTPNVRFTLTCLSTGDVVEGVTDAQGMATVNVTPCPDLQFEFEDGFAQGGETFNLGKPIPPPVYTVENGDKDLTVEGVYVKQGTSTVIVVDIDGNPIPGVEVTNSNGDKGVTDENGEVTFPSSGQSTYSVNPEQGDNCLVSENDIDLENSPNNNNAESAGEFIFAQKGDVAVQLKRDDSGQTPITGQVVTADVEGTKETFAESGSEPGTYIRKVINGDVVTFDTPDIVTPSGTTLFFQFANPGVQITQDCAKGVVLVYGPQPTPVASPSPNI